MPAQWRTGDTRGAGNLGRGQNCSGLVVGLRGRSSAGWPSAGWACRLFAPIRGDARWEEWDSGRRVFPEHWTRGGPQALDGPGFLCHVWDCAWRRSPPRGTANAGGKVHRGASGAATQEPSLAKPLPPGPHLKMSACWCCRLGLGCVSEWSGNP